MHRLSRQLAATRRIFRCTNAPVARSTVLVHARNYARPIRPGKDAESTPPSSETLKTLSKSVEAESSLPEKKDFKINNLDELLEVLDSQAGQEALLMLSESSALEFQNLMSKVMESNGEGNVHVMHAVAELLSSPNFNLEVTVPLPELYKQDALSEEESKILEEANVNPEAVDPDILAGLEAKKAALEGAEPEEVEKRPYPNLMSPDPLMDSREVLDLTPTATNPFHNRVIVRNHRSIFHEALAHDGFDFDNPNWVPTKSDLAEEEMGDGERAGLPDDYPLDKLMIFTLLSRFITQQTGKGKIKHYQVFAVVGNGDGMVGLGMGTDEEPSNAFTKARIAAYKNMDYVDRFENRTIWTEMSGKFRSTEIRMRPRPMGFGLRCQPTLHQILKAAGIKDVSAKIWGSRNPLMIMQGALRMLQGGHNPLGFGNGIGGKGKRMHKGVGMRGKFHVERERGRKLRDFRK